MLSSLLETLSYRYLPYSVHLGLERELLLLPEAVDEAGSIGLRVRVKKVVQAEVATAKGQPAVHQDAA